MSIDTEGCTIYLALALAIVAAMLSTPGRGASSSLDPPADGLALAGAIAENPRIIVPP
jgi:hypothetical protein